MKIFTHFEQNSLEWMAFRAGKITASEADALISPEGKIRAGEGVATYLAQKLAETRLGPLPTYQSAFMEYGNILEEFALPWFSLEYGIEPKRVGFISDDAERIGCSPDGLLGDDCGLELKCPKPDTHVKYLLAGTVPKDYILQVQFSLYVTGRKHWKFVSYCRRMPALVLDVQPIPEIQKAIAEALQAFFVRYDAAIERLSEMAGEPWKRPLPPTPQPEPESIDIIP